MNIWIILIDNVKNACPHVSYDMHYVEYEIYLRRFPLGPASDSSIGASNTSRGSTGVDFLTSSSSLLTVSSDTVTA